MLYRLIRPLLFTQTPADAHRSAIRALRVLATVQSAARFEPKHASEREVMGLRFANPIGLAAGFDKSGLYIDDMAALGFGFIEVGSVTPRPQPGNPPPNLFRLVEDDALINRMGFNNDGVEATVRRLEKRRYKGICGVNIGKNFDTPLENASSDYVKCLRAVYATADYITVNISSPNTPGLRDLQHENSLEKLLGDVVNERELLQGTHSKRVPLVVKIAPDLDETGIDSICRVLEKSGFDGVCATNTTITRPQHAALQACARERRTQRASRPRAQQESDPCAAHAAGCRLPDHRRRRYREHRHRPRNVRGRCRSDPGLLGPHLSRPAAGDSTHRGVERSTRRRRPIAKAPVSPESSNHAAAGSGTGATSTELGEMSVRRQVRGFRRARGLKCETQVADARLQSIERQREQREGVALLSVQVRGFVDRYFEHIECARRDELVAIDAAEAGYIEPRAERDALEREHRRVEQHIEVHTRRADGAVPSVRPSTCTETEKVSPTSTDDASG